MTRLAGVNGQGVWPHPLLPGYDGVEQPGGVGGVADGELPSLLPSNTGREVQALERGWDGWWHPVGSNPYTADGRAISTAPNHTSNMYLHHPSHHTTPLHTTPHHTTPHHTTPHHATPRYTTPHTSLTGVCSMHIPVSVRDSGWPPSSLHSIPCDSGRVRGECEGVSVGRGV